MANVNTTFGQLPIAIGITGAEIFPLDQAGTTKQATLRQAVGGALFTNFPAGIDYVIDGQGTQCTVGPYGVLKAPFAGTINAVDVYGNLPNGSASVDVWRCTYSQYDGFSTHPVAGDSILGGNYPTITVGSKATVSFSSGIPVAAGDLFAFNLISVTAFTRVITTLNLIRPST